MCIIVVCSSLKLALGLHWIVKRRLTICFATLRLTYVLKVVELE